MKILLTGGSGFIGKNILESYLAEKYEFLAPAHKELDMTDERQVNEYFLNHKIDTVIHSAGKPGHRNAKDPSNVFYHNTRMFFNLINNSHHYNKMIILGSGAVYDMLNYVPKMKEEYFGTFMPKDEHGFSRYICTKYIESLKNVIELRIFGIFGKYEDYAIRFISNAICKSLYDLPITIKQNRKFDYIYVDDLIPILDYFIQNNSQYNCYNITPDQSIELYKLAEKVRKISGKDLPILVNQTGMGLEYSGDNSRLRQEMCDIKFTPIDEAIYKLYNWYSDNKHLINRETLLFDK